ncbi:hypothetical protein M569_05165 [Genlisea aurea]|uniref:Uncharacterized protein n=1 Tax=Genlisea aurea TaxID=192259 RepID=S8CQX0_9LAMI|nr:hypothetical protein M569_05165 [Genlisea aurea]
MSSEAGHKRNEKSPIVESVAQYKTAIWHYVRTMAMAQYYEFNSPKCQMAQDSRFLSRLVRPGCLSAPQLPKMPWKETVDWIPG